MFAVVITGPPGAGKTAVLTGLANALSDDDVQHAAIESEALRWAHPGLDDRQEMRHLRAMCALYRDAGYRLLLIGQTIESDESLAELIAAIGPDESFVVRLEADPRTLVERIVEREPKGWSGLDGLIEHTQELAARAPGPGTINLVVSTDGQLAETVASRIRGALPRAFGALGSSQP